MQVSASSVRRPGQVPEVATESRISRSVPVTVNDVLDGHVELHLDCPERLYLHGYLAQLPGGRAYYFYLWDARFGPALIKICTYCPWPMKIWVNGHVPGADQSISAPSASSSQLLV